MAPRPRPRPEGRAAPPVELDLRLGNSIAAVEASRLALAPLLEAAAISAAAANRVEVVLEELVSNVVRHGFTEGSDQSIRLRCTFGDGWVELFIEDDGAPFDPLAEPEPAKFDRIETARLGGLGIPLVRKLTSSVRYERVRGQPAAGDFSPVNRVIARFDAG